MVNITRKLGRSRENHASLGQLLSQISVASSPKRAGGVGSRALPTTGLCTVPSGNMVHSPLAPGHPPRVKSDFPELEVAPEEKFSSVNPVLFHRLSSLPPVRQTELDLCPSWVFSCGSLTKRLTREKQTAIKVHGAHHKGGTSARPRFGLSNQRDYKSS